MIFSDVLIDLDECILSIETKGHAIVIGIGKSDTNMSVPLSIESKEEKSKEERTSQQVKVEQAVCVAVSTVEQQFFYALSELLGISLKVEMDIAKGFFVLKNIEGMITTRDEDSHKIWKTLSQALIIGYKMIEHTHHQYFSCQIHIAKNS